MRPGVTAPLAVVAVLVQASPPARADGERAAGSFRAARADIFAGQSVFNNGWHPVGLGLDAAVCFHPGFELAAFASLNVQDFGQTWEEYAAGAGWGRYGELLGFEVLLVGGVHAYSGLGSEAELSPEPPGIDTSVGFVGLKLRATLLLGDYFAVGLMASGFTDLVHETRSYEWTKREPPSRQVSQADVGTYGGGLYLTVGGVIRR